MNDEAATGAEVSSDAVSRPHQSPRRTALAGLIGNVMEWFDFAVYGYFASVIGGQFFPQSSPGAQQLLTFAVFAIGFGARPIGSLVLGAVGDRIGRRALLVLSIVLMGGSTLLIGLLPPYESIGVAAPILLVALRILQGFSVGGEFTGSMVYTTELAPSVTRGLVSSSAAAGVTLGFHPRIRLRHVDPRPAVAGTGRVLWLAHPFHRQRAVPGARRSAPARPAGDRARYAGRGATASADPFIDRGLAADAADLRHRRDDQCRLLSVVHVHGR